MRPLRAALLLVLALVAPSRAPARPPQGWDPVTPAELALADSRIEPGAAAEAIFWKVWVEHEALNNGRIRQTRDVYARIKVFTAAGARRYGKVDVDYPLRNVSVRDVRARTIHADGTEFPLARGAVVKETVVRRKGAGWRRQSFALPAVEPGSLVEYRYREIRYDEVKSEYDLQLDLPAQRISYFVKPLDVPLWFLRQMRFSTNAVFSDSAVGGYYETRATDEPAYRAEPYGPSERQQKAWLLQYYTMANLLTPQRFWTGFARSQADFFDQATLPTGETRTLAMQIVAGDTTASGRLRRLGEWIQREFRVIEDDPDSLGAAGLGETRTLRDALRRKAGTHSDAMLVFGALARSLGMETRLLRVGSSRELFFDQNMMDGAFLPTYEIAVREGPLWMPYDPASRTLPWDMLPWDQEAQLALLCAADSACFVQDPVAAPARSRITTTGRLALGEDGAVEGDVVFAFSGHFNEDLRPIVESAAGGAVDSVPLEQMQWLESGVHLSERRWVPGTDPRGALELRCHVRLEDFATRTGRRLIVEPAILRAHEASPFTASERRTPVYFRYAWSEQDSLVLDLPAGWKIDNVDVPEPFEAEGIGCRSDCHVSADGRSVVYLRSQFVGDRARTWFPVERYAALQRVFDRIRQIDRATVTLVRADGP